MKSQNLHEIWKDALSLKTTLNLMEMLRDMMPEVLQHDLERALEKADAIEKALADKVW